MSHTCPRLPLQWGMNSVCKVQVVCKFFSLFCDSFIQDIREVNFYLPYFIYRLQKELMKEIDDYLKLGKLILHFTVIS